MGEMVCIWLGETIRRSTLARMKLSICADCKRSSSWAAANFNSTLSYRKALVRNSSFSFSRQMSSLHWDTPITICLCGLWQAPASITIKMRLVRNHNGYWFCFILSQITYVPTLLVPKDLFPPFFVYQIKQADSFLFAFVSFSSIAPLYESVFWYLLEYYSTEWKDLRQCFVINLAVVCFCW